MEDITTGNAVKNGNDADDSVVFESIALAGLEILCVHGAAVATKKAAHALRINAASSTLKLAKSRA